MFGKQTGEGEKGLRLRSPRSSCAGFVRSAGRGQLSVSRGRVGEKKNGGWPRASIRQLQMTLSLQERAGDFLPGVRERRVWRGRRAIPANSGTAAPRLGRAEQFPDIFPSQRRSRSIATRPDSKLSDSGQPAAADHNWLALVGSQAASKSKSMDPRTPLTLLHNTM